jgi:hypothetical protein
MPMKREILRVVRHVDETGQGTIQAIRDLWSSLSLSTDEKRDLMQEALAARVNDALRRSYRRAIIERSEEDDVVVGVEVVEQKRELITMSVEILEQVSCDVHGQRRKVIDLTLEDTSYLMARTKAMLMGQIRQYQLYEYIHKKLEDTGAASVRGFGVREQKKIAQMLVSIEEREELRGLPPSILQGQLEAKTKDVN